MVNLILIILGILVMILAGFLIAYLARDEIIAGRRWFRIIMAASFIIGVGNVYRAQYYVAMACLFLFIVSLISLVMSYTNKFDRKNK